MTERSGTVAAIAAAGLVLLYLAAWRHGVSVEHLGVVEDRLRDAALGGRPTFDMVTGGGALFVALMDALHPLGSLASLLVAHAVLDLVVVLVWARAGRDVLPAPLFATLALATFWIPKAHIAENSVFVGFVAPLLFLATLWAHRRATPASLAAVAACVLLVMHFSLTGAVVVPAVLVAVAVGPGGVVRRPLAGVAAVGLVGALLAVPAATTDGAVAFSAGILSDIFGGPRPLTDPRLDWLPLRLYLNPLVLLGVYVAWTERTPVHRLALAWYGLSLLPISALALFGEAGAYHFAVIAPAWAVLVGVGCQRGVEVLSARLGRPLVPAACGLWLASAALCWALPPGEPPEEFACWTLLDGAPPCRSRPLLDRLAQLQALDALDPEQPTRFYGSHGPCLTGAWTWLGARGEEPPRQLLLLERSQADDALAERLGGWLTDDLIVLPGVVPISLDGEAAGAEDALAGRALRWGYMVAESDNQAGPQEGEPDLGGPYLAAACWDLDQGPSSAEIAAGWALLEAPDPQAPQGWLDHAAEEEWPTVLMLAGPRR